MSEDSLTEQSLTSDETHKSSSMSTSGIPIIPPRPRSKNREKSTTSLMSNSSGKSSEPEPKTTTKDEKENNGKSEAPELELLDAYGDDPEEPGDKTTQQLQSDGIQSRYTDSVSPDSLEEPPQDTEDENVPMNHQTNDQDLVDGDKTPGNSNTKASFKEDLDDANATDNETSSFNDDMETVLQESHDSSDDASDHSNRADSLTQDMPVGQLQGSPIELSKNEEVKYGSKENEVNEIKKEDQPNNASTGDKDEHIIKPEQENPLTNDEPRKQVKADQDSPTEKSITTASKVPVIPARPVRRPTTTHSSLSSDKEPKLEESAQSTPVNNDLEPQNVASDDTVNRSSGTNNTSQEENRIVLNEAVETNASIPSEKSPVPTIPVRPTKKQVDSKSAPKAPPPKPKKLSSKIEAFQQQLFHSSSSHGLSSKPGTGTSNEDDGATKGSSVHRKVFETSGIPLPGMFNPAMRPVAREPKLSSREELPKEAKTTKTTKRVRGPKGKRLPQAVANANVVSEKSRDLEKGSLWAFTFTKTKSSKIDNDGHENTSIKDAGTTEPFHEPAEISISGSHSGSVGDLLETQVMKINSNAEEPQPLPIQRSNILTESDSKTDISDGEEIAES
ncbi:hypothetical protein CORT_0A05520 [Candida orthopsilosis Co 90-125]|uniref:Altered inheritance of mitochondria protein 21 n=1 Tax=Candida orthopsilosis (strain 90-125) TaxID=1136231 RepID=H8WXZ2_CANO9|nr:hypothetical protein CORT_0A05520 [Candida orthopsilosis Co 90-125]CCG20939.1 hypothetical protein CORT_0A05520 [Candida orthopsilosis Co 90-125]